MSAKLKNWARNLEYSASRVHRPTTTDELQEIVQRSHKVRALGSRHCFNAIADTPEDLVSMEHFERVVSLEPDRKRVTVEGGIRYGELGRYLYAKGFALENLASLPHLTVAGACVTATHGSGVANRNLAAQVQAIDFVSTNGDIISISRNADVDTFNGAVISLGSLGIAVRMTLDLLPAYEIAQNVYENLPFDALRDNFDAIMASAHSVSLFTFWTSDKIDQVWVKSKTSPEVCPDQFGAKRADGPRSPVPGASVANCTEQMGIPGPWYDRLPHFRMGFTPSSGEELQTEYFVPRECAWAALSEINAIRDQVAPLLYTTEVRCIAADDFWMSPNFLRDCAAIHFTWRQDWDRVSRLLPVIEGRLSQFGARPHWGKLFTMKPPKLQSLYSGLPDFKALMAEMDPNGKFRNPFIDRYLFG